MDFNLRSLYRAYQGDPTNLRNYQQLVQILNRTGEQQKLLEILRHQYQAVPENQENYYALVKILVETKQLGELGFRDDPTPGRRTKQRAGPLMRVLDSGLLEYYKIPYHITIASTVDYSAAFATTADGPFNHPIPNHVTSNPCYLSISLGGNRINPTELLSAVAHCIVDRWAAKNPEIIKLMPSDTENHNSAEIILSIILHWYFNIKYTDWGGLGSFLEAIQGGRSTDENSNDVFARTFFDLKKLKLLEYFEPATQRLADFINDNYQNYGKIIKKIQKDIESFQEEPIPFMHLRRKAKAKAGSSVVEASITLLLKNGQELEFEIHNNLFNIAGFIEYSLGLYRDYLSSIQIRGIPYHQFKTLKSVITKYENRNTTSGLLIWVKDKPRQNPYDGSEEELLAWQQSPKLFAHLVNQLRKQGMSDEFVARQFVDDYYRAVQKILPQHLVEQMVLKVPKT